MKVSNFFSVTLIATIFNYGCATTLLGQEHPKCFLDGDFNDQITFGIGNANNCDDNDFATFAAMSKQELLNYLITIDNFDCFGRKVFYYRQNQSEQLFASDKINHIANYAITLADSFNGVNNGIDGLFQYLYVAVTQNFNYGLPINTGDWQTITNACTTLSSNTYIINATTYDANILSGYLFATCWANNIPSQSEIIYLVQQVLYQHGEQQYWQSYSAGDSNEHAYYFKLSFLLETFFFYAVRDYNNEQNPKFYLRLNENPYYHLITSLSFTACDVALQNLGDSRIKETTLFAAKALNILSGVTARDQTETLYQNYLKTALLQVLDCYEYLEPVWINAAEALIDNQTDIGYEIETVRSELKDREFPNQHIFEDGKLIFYSSLPDNDVLGLYESLQQVKAQFFRLFELTDQMPVADDPNEVVQIRIYTNGDAYRNYNSFLFNAVSPGGGVYIENPASLREDYATIYTWDRTPAESYYTLEELVRHEYTHYLQARYLIKGFWGDHVNPFYENERLVWFEEGMAEFFSGSTTKDGIIDRAVIKNHISNNLPITLQRATTSGYTSNTYNFGSVIWSNWFQTNRKRFRDLSYFTRMGDLGIDDFDTYVNNFIISDQQNFQSHIDCLRQNVCETWTPTTISLNYDQFNTGDLTILKNDFTGSISNISNIQIEEQYQSAVRRYRLSGNYMGNTGNSSEERLLNLYTRLDEILVEIGNESPLNNFDYATAYYSNVNTLTNPPSAQFHIVGPLKEASKNVYPGDVNFDGIVNAADVMHIGHYFNQSIGQQNTVDITWQPQSRTDWDINQTAIFCHYGYEDLKHVDCNGDGTIDVIDLNAIQQNWNNTHNDAPLIQPIIPCFYFDDFSDYQLLLQPVGIVNNNVIILDVVLERISNAPFTVLSGFLDIGYSNNINSVQLIYNNSWFGTPNIDFRYLTNLNQTAKRLESGFTKTNLTNSVGSGIIGQLELQVNSEIGNNVILFAEFGFQNEQNQNYLLQKQVEIELNGDLIQGTGSSICFDELIIGELTPIQNQYNSINIIETNGFISIGQNQQVEFNANRVILSTGFTAKAGTNFKVRNVGCD